MSSVLVEQDGVVTRLTLNRPERRNALSLDTLRELDKALASVPSEARVVVLGAAGPAFAAGHDLGEMIDRPTAFYEELFGECIEVMQRIHRMAQPVIARVHGVATAAGCQLVAACDLAIASEDARFGLPGVKIGLFCSTPIVPVSRAIGPKRSMEMLLTGREIDAHTAVSWGLVNKAVPTDQLDSEIDAWVGDIVAFSGPVIGLGKEAFHRQVGLDETGAYELAKEVMVVNAEMADAQEGMGAFLEKRRPKWRGQDQS